MSLDVTLDVGIVLTAVINLVSVMVILGAARRDKVADGTPTHQTD